MPSFRFSWAVWTLAVCACAAAPATVGAGGPSSERSESVAESGPDEWAPPEGNYPDRGAGASHDGADRRRGDSKIFRLGTARLLRTADASPSDVLSHLGLEPPGDCAALESTASLRRRRRRWSAALHMLARTHTDYVYDWLIGIRSPPKTVLEEVRRQRDCLLDALFRRARSSESELRVELVFGDVAIRSPSRVEYWQNAYFDRGSARQKVREAVTESFYRSAEVQADIWGRKMRFLGSAFDRISERAASRCELRAGAKWDPDRERHEECWRRHLSKLEREREILAASSAPGLSRHHWGTELDLFALSPEEFRPEGEHHDEYRWMKRNAARWGFYQSYGRDAEAYLEERWHWSYAPIAGALTRFASRHRHELERRLVNLWNRIERSHNGEHPGRPMSLTYVRRVWQKYAFGVSQPPGAPR